MGGGGGCGAVRYRGGGAPMLRISQKKGVFYKTSACPRLVKEGYFLYTGTKYKGGGGGGVKIPLQTGKEL